MFILEGVIVLCADAVKIATGKLQRPKAKAVFAFQFVFIFFFGFFALMVFGPEEAGAFSFLAKYNLVKSLFADQIQTPLLTLIGFRMLRLARELFDGGVFGARFYKRPLELSGGGWMLLFGSDRRQDRPQPPGRPGGARHLENAG